MGSTISKQEDLSSHTFSPRLCDCCLSMTGSVRGLEALKSISGYRHLSKIDLALNAEAGCPCCKMLWAKAFELWPDTFSDELPWNPRVVAIHASKPSSKDFNGDALNVRHDTFCSHKLDSLRYIRCMGDSDVKEWIKAENSFEITIFASQQDTASNYVEKHIATNTGSTQLIEQVKEWLSLCHSEGEGHAECASLKENYFSHLPTRVIAVGDAGQNHVELYESAFGEAEHYIALSYCWGGPQAVTTTTKSLRKNMTGLTLSSLPQTIRDAIITTRRLGYKYLWVDALCIIQDSDQDKEWEIKKMGEYYKNAALTIAAASGSSATAGFLHSRPTKLTCQLPLYLLDGQLGTISIIAAVHNERPREPLYSRAWALQEFLLSPRVLIFGTQEAIWHCQSTISPVVPSHISYDFSWPCKRLPITFNALQPPGWRLRSILDRHHHEAIEMARRREVWASVVGDYTSRQLTFPEDRLPALAGVARELEKAWNDTYVAGMWRNSLLEWLIWKSDCPTQTLAPSVAPSWSWGSQEGKITFPQLGLHKKDSAEILGCDGIEGGIKGQLHLSAVVMPLMTVCHSIQVSKSEVSHEEHLWTVEDDFNIIDNGKLQVLLLGFGEEGAFCLIVKPNDGKFYTRVGVLYNSLSSLEVIWWGAKKQNVIII